MPPRGQQRGTVHANQRGGSLERARRRAWMVEAYGVAANVRPECPGCSSEIGGSQRRHGGRD